MEWQGGETFFFKVGQTIAYQYTDEKDQVERERLTDKSGLRGLM